MEPCRRVRVAKCQMLATSFFVLLLGSAMAATAALSYFGPHFAVIGHVSADRRTYEAVHHWGLPELRPGVLRPGTGGLLEAPQPHPGGGRRAGRLRPGLRPGGEERVRNWAAGAGGHAGHVLVLWQELAPRAPGGLGGRPVSGGRGHQTGAVPGPGGAVRAHTLPSAQDCLQGIQSFLRVHGNIVSTLISLGLAFTAYAMLLSSFIWFTIRSGRYSVSQRARSHPPQEPRVYRCIQEGSRSPRRPSKADAPKGRLSPSRCSGQLLLPRDTHPPAHGSGDATVCTRM
ncbi:tetraspanin-32 isoform X4 [Cervus elaphus]|uniref:tetraspanin-32 isoform X4 n=1 Tax=Cervus elaphus TaxID=9860 RepID=UPI001CC2B15C|nr:tetraspanin-32 isoform X4 [Cervus elaphus]